MICLGPRKRVLLFAASISQKGDIVGQKLRVGAILIPEEFVLIHTGSFINNYDPQNLIFGRVEKKIII